MLYHVSCAPPRPVHPFQRCRTHSNTRWMHHTGNPHVRLERCLGQPTRKIEIAAKTAIPLACHSAAPRHIALERLPTSATIPALKTAKAAKTAIPQARQLSAIQEDIILTVIATARIPATSARIPATFRQKRQEHSNRPLITIPHRKGIPTCTPRTGNVSGNIPATSPAISYPLTAPADPANSRNYRCSCHPTNSGNISGNNSGNISATSPATLTPGILHASPPTLHESKMRNSAYATSHERNDSEHRPLIYYK